MKWKVELTLTDRNELNHTEKEVKEKVETAIDLAYYLGSAKVTEIHPDHK